MHGLHWAPWSPASAECSALLVPGGLIMVTVPDLYQSQVPTVYTFVPTIPQVPLPPAAPIRVAIFTPWPPVSREKVPCLLCPSPPTLDPVPFPSGTSFPCPPAPSLAPIPLLLVPFHPKCKHTHGLPTPHSAATILFVLSFTTEFL